MDGAHFTSAHAPNLLETPTRHACVPLPFERIRGSAASWLLVSLWRAAKSAVQAPTLEIHRKQRLPTDTAEETETRLGACPSAVLESRIHAFIYNVSTFHVLL